MPQAMPSYERQNHVTLLFAGQAVILEGDMPFDHDMLEELSQTVTAMELCDHPDISGNVPRVIHTETDDISVTYDAAATAIELRGPMRTFGRGTSLIYIAEYLAACTLAAKQGDFLAHTAAIYDPETDRSDILFGEKGAGKTTLAIRLCKEGGRHIIGNDQVYIGSDTAHIYTLGGNAWFNVRRTAITSDAYLQRFLADEQTNPQRAAWNDKYRFIPEDIGITRKIGKTLVNGLFHIRLDPTQDGLYTAPWHGVQRNLLLHERLGRHVSGQATPLQDDNGNYLGSLPLINHTETMKNRDMLVRRIIDAGITEVFAPDSAAATEYMLASDPEAY